MSKTVYLTKDWLKKLQEEFDTLKNVTRVEIAAKLKEAISFWDLSENAEYEEARNEQAQVELRITDVENQLKNVELIDENVDHDKVTMWTIVILQNTSDKKKETYKIVGSMEADILSEPPMISNESPVWKAILWKKSWTTVKVSAPSGNFEYKIIEIK